MHHTPKVFQVFSWESFTTFFSNKFYFLEQFEIYRKTEKTIQSSSIPPHQVSLITNYLHYYDTSETINKLVLLLLLSHFSHVRLCATLWTRAHQALLSMGFSRQEYWSGLPCPPPKGLSKPGIEPRSPALPADSLPLNHQGSPHGIDTLLFTEVHNFY